MSSFPLFLSSSPSFLHPLSLPLFPLLPSSLSPALSFALSPSSPISPFSPSSPLSSSSSSQSLFVPGLSCGSRQPVQCRRRSTSRGRGVRTPCSQGTGCTSCPGPPTARTCCMSTPPGRSSARTAPPPRTSERPLLSATTAQSQKCLHLRSTLCVLLYCTLRGVCVDSIVLYACVVFVMAHVIHVSFRVWMLSAHLT